MITQQQYLLPQYYPNYPPPTATIAQVPYAYMDCILDSTDQTGGLYVGDIVSSRKADLLTGKKIQAILSCAPDIGNYPLI